MTPTAEEEWSPSAGIYAGRGYIGIVAEAGHRLRMMDPGAFSTVLKDDAPADAVGRALLDAIGASRFLTVEAAAAFRPSVSNAASAWFESIAASVGVSSKAALLSKMKHCLGSVEGGLVRLVPTKRTGRGNWAHCSEATEISETSSAWAIGEAVRSALSRCS